MFILLRCVLYLYFLDILIPAAVKYPIIHFNKSRCELTVLEPSACFGMTQDGVQSEVWPCSNSQQHF